MTFSLFRRLKPSMTIRRAGKKPLALERLEDRTVPAHLLDALYVGDPGPDLANPGDDTVHRFNAATGAYLGTFVEPGSGNVINPNGIVFGNRNTLLLANQNIFQPINGEVLAYHAKTGKFKGPVVAADDPNAPFAPHGMIVVDRTIYVADLDGGRVRRYEERTGAFLGDLDLAGYPGPFNPRALVVGPDGYLYVSVMDVSDPPGGSILAGWIMRFDLATNSFHDVFVANELANLADVNDLHRPDGMAFGPDGRLYVTAVRGSTLDTDKVLIFNGTTGALEGHIALDVVGGARAFALACLFGPDGKLFVPITQGDPDTAGSVRRYDVATGTYDVFVAPTSLGGPMARPQFLTFGHTDSATLAYAPPRNALLAKTVPGKSHAGTAVTQEQLSALVTEAIARWQATGADVSTASRITIQVANLPGAQLGYTTGQTIWIDANAAGWDWFVDPTPQDDREFTKGGSQGERKRVDLLTVVMHEMGHALGYSHQNKVVMQEALATGTRQAPVSVAVADQLFASAVIGLGKRRGQIAF